MAEIKSWFQPGEEKRTPRSRWGGQESWDLAPFPRGLDCGYPARGWRRALWLLPEVSLLEKLKWGTCVGGGLEYGGKNTSLNFFEVH